MRASILSVLASWPVPSANLRTRAGLTMDAGTPSASKACMRGRSSPPVASTMTPRTFSVLRRRASAMRPSASLMTRTGVPVVDPTSKCFLQMSTPIHAPDAVISSLPCLRPCAWQPFGLMMGRDGIWLHAGSRLWLGSISDPAKRSPLGGIASPTQCLSRERQGWVKRSADPTHARFSYAGVGSSLALDPTYAWKSLRPVSVREAHALEQSVRIVVPGDIDREEDDGGDDRANEGVARQGMADQGGHEGEGGEQPNGLPWQTSEIDRHENAPVSWSQEAATLSDRGDPTRRPWRPPAHAHSPHAALHRLRRNAMSTQSLS